MQIEKINENKLKVILHIEDLNNKNISLQAFMANSIKNENLIFEILDSAKEKFNFKFKPEEICIESFAIPSKSLFILFIKIVPNQNKTIKLSHTLYKKLTLFTFVLCEFNCFEDFCMFCNFINKKINIKSSLFLLNNTYYLHITFNKIKDIKFIISILYEFANNIFINGNISQYAKVLIKTNAFEISKKYFI